MQSIKNLASNIGLLLLLTLPAMARQGVNVNCQKGGQTVVVLGVNSTNFVMQSYPGCQIKVLLTGTGTLATIFADNLGTPLGNPFNASSLTGAGLFYADNGRYDIQLSGGNPSPGITPALTVSDILLNDPSSSLGCSALPALTGDVTSAGATCTTVLPNITTAGTGLKTTTNAKGQVTGVTTAASTDLSDSSIIARLNAAANFGLNSITGGIINGAAGVFAGSVTDAGETVSGEIAPDVTGRQIGDTSHQWDAFIRNITISGTFVIPSLNLSSLTVSGLITSGAINTGGGSAVSPGIAFTGDTNTGIFDLSPDNLAISTNGVGRQQVNSSGIFIPATECFDWNSGSLGSSQDTGICRDSAGSVDIGNGLPGDKSGTINANGLNLSSFMAVSGVSSTKVVRDARQDGVVCDGVTEDGVHINTALTNAVAAQQSIVILPAGSCKVSTSLNMTNRSGLKLRGGGMGNHTETPVGLTKILCNTGTSPCIDRTGSSEGALEELTLNIQNAFSTPSQVAILMGRDNAAGGGAGPFCFAQFNHDTHLQIETDSNLLLNSGQGYVGIYDVNAELYSIEDSDIIANTPAWFDTANTLAIVSAYQTLQTGCSASMTGVTSKNTGWTGEGNGANQIFNIQGSPTGDFRFTQTFLGWAVSSGCNAGGQFAIRTGTGTVFSLVVDETTDYEENCAPGGFLFANGNIKHSQIHPQTAVPNGTSAWFVPSNASTWTDVDFGITKANSGDTTQNLLGNVNTVTITGSTIRTNETISPISLSNVTLTGDTVVAPGFTPSNVTFNSASTYTLQSSAGTSIIGPFTADASTGRVTKYNSLAVNQTGSIGVVPQLCWASRTGQTAAITTTTVPGCSSLATQTLYMVNADVSCNTSSAAATATLTVGWTDESNTAQTAANTATCTTLGASSHGSFYQVFTAKSATNITYAVSIANTPTYDVRVSVTQLGTN